MFEFQKFAKRRRRGRERRYEEWRVNMTHNITQKTKSKKNAQKRYKQERHTIQIALQRKKNHFFYVPFFWLDIVSHIYSQLAYVCLQILETFARDMRTLITTPEAAKTKSL